jgi:hypothetical protein
MKDIYIQGIYHMFIISKNDILLHVTLETFHNSHAKTLVSFLTISTHVPRTTNVPLQTDIHNLNQ